MSKNTVTHAQNLTADELRAIPGLYCPSCHGDPQGYDESLIRLDSARVSCYICNWTGNEAAAITLPDLD